MINISSIKENAPKYLVGAGVAVAAGAAYKALKQHQLNMGLMYGSALIFSRVAACWRANWDSVILCG